MKRRRQRIDSNAHARRRAAHGGACHRLKEVAARASGGGRRPGRWLNRPVRPNGPAWQLGWRRVSGQI
jgi:hypothetical protein